VISHIIQVNGLCGECHAREKKRGGV
jgi:hypothetical protein